MPELDIITRIMDSEIGVNLISIILGLGLASLFRKVCRNKDCIIIKGPKLSSIKDKIFKHDDKCYKYQPVSTSCKK